MNLPPGMNANYAIKGLKVGQNLAQSVPYFLTTNTPVPDVCVWIPIPSRLASANSRAALLIAASLKIPTPPNTIPRTCSASTISQLLPVRLPSAFSTTPVTEGRQCWSENLHRRGAMGNRF